MEKRGDLTEFLESILRCDRDLRPYIDGVERELGREIYFTPTANASRADVDWNSCFECCPIIRVNLNWLGSLENPQALLAHEVTHIQLVLVEGYPWVEAKTRPSKSQQKLLTVIANSVQDLVVEDRLLGLGFDMSRDIQVAFEHELEREEKGKARRIPGVKKKDQDLIDAFLHAGYYLSRYTTPDQKKRLSKAHKGERTNVWAWAQEIIQIVQTTSDILKPEGQCRALKRLRTRFGLDNAYLIKSAANPSFLNEVS